MDNRIDVRDDVSMLSSALRHAGWTAASTAVTNSLTDGAVGVTIETDKAPTHLIQRDRDPVTNSFTVTFRSPSQSPAAGGSCEAHCAPPHVVYGSRNPDRTVNRADRLPARPTAKLAGEDAALPALVHVGGQLEQPPWRSDPMITHFLDAKGRHLHLATLRCPQIALAGVC
jgi:hypothetical protein